MSNVYCVNMPGLWRDPVIIKAKSQFEAKYIYIKNVKAALINIYYNKHHEHYDVFNIRNILTNYYGVEQRYINCILESTHGFWLIDISLNLKYCQYKINGNYHYLSDAIPLLCKKYPDCEYLIKNLYDSKIVEEIFHADKQSFIYKLTDASFKNIKDIIQNNYLNIKCTIYHINNDLNPITIFRILKKIQNTNYKHILRMFNYS